MKTTYVWRVVIPNQKLAKELQPNTYNIVTSYFPNHID